MIRRPPRSTLFPTRRSSDLRSVVTGLDLRDCRIRCCDSAAALQHSFSGLAADTLQQALDSGLAEEIFLTVPALSPRSEEHTSELQSQSNLVCRLLLEKKKHI